MLQVVKAHMLTYAVTYSATKGTKPDILHGSFYNDSSGIHYKSPKSYIQLSR